MVPPFAASKAADARPAEPGLWRGRSVSLCDHQPIRLGGASTIPAGGPGLPAAAVQPDHAGDRGVAARDAARHGAVAGLQAGGFAPRQRRRAGIDPGILHRFVVPHGLLEPRSILYMATVPIDR